MTMAISGDLKHMRDNREARLACRRSEVLSQREHPSPPRARVLHALGREPWVEALVFNFLKTELRVHLLPVRALSFLVKGCNSSPGLGSWAHNLLCSFKKVDLGQASYASAASPGYWEREKDRLPGCLGALSELIYLAL